MKAEKLIIDGHNLLKAPNSRVPGIGIYEEELAHLVRLIRSWQAGERHQVTIVFDGNRPDHPELTNGRGVQLRFSGAGKTADEVIQQMVRRAPHPGKILVVTSDRAIQFTARDHGAQVCGSNEFWNQLSSPSQPPTPAPPEEKPNGVSNAAELKEWMDLFQRNGQDDDEI